MFNMDGFDKYHREMAEILRKHSYNTITKLGQPCEIKKVIFNEPATVVLWADGTKTVVKTQEGEDFDPEKGLAMAIAKKAMGNQGNYYEVFKKWCYPWYEQMGKEPVVDEVLWRKFGIAMSLLGKGVGI